MLKVSKRKYLLGSAFLTFSGPLCSVLAPLLGIRFLTELVSPEMFGQVALLNGIAVLGAAVFAYPFIIAGMRLLPECRNYRERWMLNKVVFGFSACATTLAIILVMLGGAVFCYLSGLEIGLFVLTCLLLAVTVRREFGIRFLTSEHKRRGAKFLQIGDSILRPLLAIWFVWGLGQNPEAVLLGYVVASVVSNALWTVSCGERVKKRSINQPFLNCHYKRKVWGWALSLIPMELVCWFSGLGDRYVIGYLLTATEVGLYVASYTIVNEVFNRSAMLCMNSFQPSYLRSFSAGKQKEAFSVLWLWIVTVVGLGLIVGCSALVGKEWLASMLLAKPYHSAIELIPIFVIGSTLNAIATVMAQPLLARKHPQTLLKGRFCGVLAAAISLPLMISSFGLIGAAIAHSIYFGVEALIITLLARPWSMTSQVSGCQAEPIQNLPLIHDYESIGEKSIALSADS